MASKQLNRVPKPNHNDYVLYHLNNSGQCQGGYHSGTVSISKNNDQALAINRKMQNMRHVIKKIQEIDKAGELSNSNKLMKSEFPSKEQTNQTNLFLVNRFMRSRRLMVTSTVLSSNYLTVPIKNVQIQGKKSGRFTLIEEEFEKIQIVFKEKEKMRRFFQRTAINYENKCNPFEPSKRVLSMKKSCRRQDGKNKQKCIYL